jgi:hypothetical protein
VDNLQQRDELPRIKLLEAYSAEALTSKPSFLNSFVLYCTFWNDDLDFVFSMNSFIISKKHGCRFTELFNSNLKRLVQDDLNV